MDKLLQEDYLALHVLNCIREHKDISRTAISKLTKLSKATVTRSVDKLISYGYIQETGFINDSSSKRKPVSLFLNPEKYYAIGLLANQRELRSVVVDFCGNTVLSLVSPIPKLLDKITLHNIILNTINEMLQGASHFKEKIIGIGIGLPGLIDYKNGVVLNYASESAIMNFNIRDEIEQKTGIPTFVDNNVKALALGEVLQCHDKSVMNSIYISCWEGIGGAVVAQGKLLRGYSNTVGEIGHMIVNPNGKKCRCGKYGCVETYCYSDALSESISESIRRGRKTSLAFDCKVYPTLYDIMKAYEQGDELCREHILMVAKYLSLCFSNVINILNTETLFLTGPLFEISESFFDLVCELTREKLFSGQNDKVIFIRRLTTDSNYSIGGASLVFSNYFQLNS